VATSLIPIPDDVAKKIAAAERTVQEDLERLDRALDEIDAIPTESFDDDDSLVHHVEEIRASARGAEKVAARAKRISASPISASMTALARRR
jgi:hypothetical protein